VSIHDFVRTDQRRLLMYHTYTCPHPFGLKKIESQSTRGIFQCTQHTRHRNR